jgi:hypothetical protein
MYHRPRRVSSRAASRARQYVMRARGLFLDRSGRTRRGDAHSPFGPLAKAARTLGTPPVPQPFADADGDNDRVIVPLFFPHQRTGEVPGRKEDDRG